MIDFSNKNTIFWDFDGVIIDSEVIRVNGFKEVLQKFPASEVEKLIDYHIANGGISRYVKFRYFFEEIRNEKISNEQIQNLANDFSQIMLKSLQDKNLLIPESVNFIKQHYDKLQMFIVSGSDQEELRNLCSALGIAQYFNEIFGSPTAKPQLVSDLLKLYNLDSENCLLIGDSINDYDAAKENGMHFYGYNNSSLKNTGKGYIESFEEIL
ncbi:MAG: HAD-IA family hydrolase [Christiangramia sp.]